MVMTVLNPVVWGLIVASAVGEPDLSVFVGTGLAAMASSIPAESVIMLLQERQWLALEHVAVSQVHTGVVLAGRLLGMMLHALLSLPIAAILLVLVYGPPDVPDPSVVVAALLVGIAGLLAISLLIVGFIARRRYRAGMPNAVFPVVVLLAGVFVPLDALPTWLQPISRLLAVSWAMDAVRRVETGADEWSALGVGAVVAVGSLVVSMLYVARVQEVMRRSPEAYLR